MVGDLHSFPKEKIKILLVENIHQAALDEFGKAGYTQIESIKGALSEAELIEKLKDVHILGIRSKTFLSPAVFENAPKLLAVGAFCIGTNQIRLDVATQKGVAVFNSPYSSTRSVAELVLGLIIGLKRRVFEKNEAAHAGKWLKASDGCFEVRNKTLGIVGYGRIGSQLSILAESLGMRVVFYDIEPKMVLGNATPAASLDELLAKCDVVSLHVPETPQTIDMMGEREFAKMKPGAVFLNIARGKVIDPNALAEAVRNGHIAGAAVDVFPHEPATNKDAFVSPLQKLPNVVLTPHIGGSTEEAQESIGVDVAKRLSQFLDAGVSLGSCSIPELNLPRQENVHRLLHIHKNTPGILSEMNRRLSDLGVNIVGQYLKTNPEIGYVVLDIEKGNTQEAKIALETVKHTIKVRSLY